MEKSYVYYWYHHMMDDKIRKEIEKILIEKDYFRFLEWYKTLNAMGLSQGAYNEEFDTFFPIVFLPDTITVFENNKPIDEISILDRENFNKITYAKCKCG